MSALSTQPETLNFLSPLNFKFSIKKCPAIDFFAQRVNVPSIAIPPPEETDPFTAIPFSGDHISFDPLTVVFKVDEKLQNYLEIFNWLRELGFPEDFNEYAAIKQRPSYLGTGVKSDISIMILNSVKNPIYECILKDAFPTSLTGMTFNSTDPEVIFLTCEATFRYTNFVINAL